MDVIKLFPDNLIITYEKLKVCIDYIGKEDYRIVKENIDKIINHDLELIANNPELSYLPDIISKSLIVFRDKLTSGIEPSLYTDSQIMLIKMKLHTFLDYIIKKTIEQTIVHHVSVMDNHVSNKDTLLKDIKIDLYTVCWNEMDLLPFVVDYWKRFVNHAYVFDNGSDDGSIEFLSKYPWITVIRYDTNNEMDDDIFRIIKNTSWKYSIGKVDFVAVCDIDECLFSNDLETELNYMIDNEQHICRPSWYTMKSTHMFDYVEGKMLHQQMKTAHGDGHIDKAILFNPNKITDINYSAGCHQYNSVPEDAKIYDKKEIFLLHFEKPFGVEYAIKRKNELRNKVPMRNFLKGYAIHYFFPVEKIRQDYINDLNNTFDITKIIDQNNLEQ